MSIADSAKRFGFNRVYDYLDKDPRANLPKIMELVDKITPGDMMKTQRAAFRRVLADPDNNWNKMIMSLWDDIDPFILKKAFQNFIINGSITGWEQQQKMRKEHGCNIPWAILLDPTSACNLHCTGCWAAEYGNRLNLSFDEIDNIIEQGKELGVYIYIYTGGEPLMRKKDLIALCNKHNDCAFLCFTNGTLIDQAFCEEVLRVGNFIPIVSVEGFEDATDFRRGEGVYKKVSDAMDIMRKNRLGFGISCCYTAKNVDVIGSEEYFDWMIEKGAKFCWFFSYMPVGAGADKSLITQPEQREHMYDVVRGFRTTKPLFTLDFFNDGEYVGGCIAGGRRYLHINANGDMDPCVFMHYSDTNIRDYSLLEGLKRPLFMAYHNNQPFNENMLRPCPVLDNPGRLTKIVEETDAHSTEILQPEDVHVYSDRCVEVAAEWAPRADRLWASKEHNPALLVK
ncbi:MAG: radical SAM protein [Eggerthellaceae bacterium]|nr:radical SAM protein [Eggerthellaceae bacterium]